MFMMREDYFFEVDESKSTRKIFVLIIYDIVDNKKRQRFAKWLLGFGVRVQKSAFEAHLRKNKYDKLIRGIPKRIGQDDSVRIYKISGKGQIISWGKDESEDLEDIIVI